MNKISVLWMSRGTWNRCPIKINSTWWSFETCFETRFLESLSRNSHLGLEGSRSRALRLETLHRLFFMKFCKKEFLSKTVLKNDCSKFNRSKRSVAKLSLLLCCLPDGENNLPSTPFKFILNSIKNVHAPKKPQCVISATRGWGRILC